MVKKDFNIVIVEGSQKPPTFIQNLINGLLSNGVRVCLVGRDTGSRFTPTHSQNFSRIVTHYRRLNTIRILLSFGWIVITDWKAVMTARNYLSNKKGIKLKLKHWCTFSKIVHHQPDIIHFQWATHLGEYEKLIRGKKCKTIVSLRGRHINVSPIVDPAVADLYRRVFPHLDGFHAVSKTIGKEAEPYGADPKKIRVIYSLINTVFLKAFEPDKNPMRNPLSLLSLGRHHWKKGYDYGIQALQILRARGVDATYTIVANGKCPENLLYIIHNLKLQGFVKFIDSVAHHQVIDLIKSHSALLLPSLEEGIANVALEAMALGVPVITTQAGGMNEVIVEGETGWVVPVANSNALADAVVDLLEVSEETLRIIRKAAHDTVQRNNSTPQQIGKFIRFYESIFNVVDLSSADILSSGEERGHEERVKSRH